MKMNNFAFTAFDDVPPQLCFYSALVVDDYAPAKKLLEASLSNLPQIGEIDFADSGVEALNKVKAKHYDLIFLDVTMPGMDGFQTCERIRGIEGYELTPIIMVTGNTAPDSYSKWAASGGTSYVTKPIRQESFHRLNMKMFSWLEDCKAA